MTEFGAGVFATGDFLRINALPRRPSIWPAEELESAVKLLTEHLRTATGSMVLRPIQARALCEASDTRSLVGQIGAGQGKMLLSALLPVILGAKRTLLLVPAHLRQQTIDEWEKMAKHWRLQPLYGLDAEAFLGPHVRVLSYQSLSTVRFASFLEEFQPDLIIADEAHYLARTKSARGKRVFRYIRQHRDVIFIPLSGTMSRKSIRECAHLYSAALRERSPYPNEWPDVEQWSLALDEGIQDEARLAPGALSAWATPDEIEEGLNGIRRAVRRRIVETAGIVATTESGVDVSLVLQVREIEVPQAVQEAMRRIRTEYALPNGETFDAGITAWNHTRECATGFVYRWDPPAPEEWALARKEWNGFVNDAMENPPAVRCGSCGGSGKKDGGKCNPCNGSGRKRLHLDSPLMVWNAVQGRVFGDPNLVTPWTNWRDIRDSFEPNPVPVWLSNYLVADAEEWALKSGGIVWLGHTSAFTKVESTGLDDGDAAEDIGRLFTKIPFFGGGKAGEGIRTYKGPCAASIRAHGTGKNLQQWHRALLMCLPSSGAALEQVLARHHRPGQQADEVHVEFYLHSREMYQALVTARNDARFMQDLGGNEQRILSSSILAADGHSFADLPYEEKMNAASNSTDPMWAKSGSTS